MKLKRKVQIAAIIAVIVVCAIIADYLIYYMKATAQRPFPVSVEIWTDEDNQKPARTSQVPSLSKMSITNRSPEFAKIAAYAASADARSGASHTGSDMPHIGLNTEDLRLFFHADKVTAFVRKANSKDWMHVKRTKTTENAEIEAMIREMLDAASIHTSETK